MTRLHLKDIEGKALFRFLDNEIKLSSEMAQVAVLNAIPKSASKVDNCIYKDGREIYLSTKGWDTIYMLILKCRRLEDHGKAIDTSIKVVDKDAFSQKIFTVIHSIKACQPSNAHYKNLKIICNDVNSSGEFLLLITQSYILQSLRRNKEGSSAITFIYTNTCHHFGYLLYKYFLSKQKDVLHFIELLNNDKLDTLSVTDQNKFYSYIEAILTGNLNQEKLFYSTWSCDILTNTKFLSFVRTYFLYNCYESYTKKKLHSFTELSDLLHKHLESHNVRVLYEKLKDTYIQLGAVIINLYEAAKIIVEKKTVEITLPKGKYRTQVIIVFDDDIIQHLTDFMGISRPYLIIENAKHLAENRHKDMIFNLAYEDKHTLVHSNFDMELTLKKDCYLNKKSLYSKVCIDTHYLSYFLSFVDSVVTNNESIEIFMSLYDISISKLTSLVSEQKDLDILTSIFDFAKDLNTVSSGNIKERINKSTIGVKQLLTDTLNKVTSYKIYIIGLLKDSVLYADFKYFINSYFIDTRGRVYNNSVYLNNQTFLNAKMFVKFYRNEHYEINLYKYYGKIKNIIADKLLFKEQKQKILDISYEEYLIQDKQLRYAYIYSFFDTNKMSHERLQQLYYSDVLNSSETLELLYNCLKKKKKLFIVHSLLLLERFPQANIENYYEIDATCSGLQMVSILLNSKSLAQLCNLIGHDQIDVYMLATTKFQIELANMKTFMDKFILYHQIEDPTVFNSVSGIHVDKDKFISYTNPTDRLIAFLQMDILNSTYGTNLINTITDDINNAGFIIPSYKELVWLLSDQDLKFQKNNNKETKIYQCLMTLKKVVKVLSIVSEQWIIESNLLHSRDLFKKAIMTYFYNATSYGRKDDFEKFFFSGNVYIMKTIKNILSIKYLSTILDHYFIHFMVTEVNDSSLMKQLSKIISKQTKPIYISNKFFDIRFAPMKETIRIIQIASYNKQRGHQITVRERSDELNSKAIRTSFTPNMIHSMDASIAHMFIERMVHIHKDLFKKVEEYFEINFQLNHDTFCSVLRVYLKIILEDCYRELLQSNYINFLDDLESNILEKVKSLVYKDKLDLTNINPHFMK